MGSQGRSGHRAWSKVKAGRMPKNGRCREGNEKGQTRDKLNESTIHCIMAGRRSEGERWSDTGVHTCIKAGTRYEAGMWFTEDIFLSSTRRSCGDMIIDHYQYSTNAICWIMTTPVRFLMTWCLSGVLYRINVWTWIVGLVSICLCGYARAPGESHSWCANAPSSHSTVIPRQRHLGNESSKATSIIARIPPPTVQHLSCHIYHSRHKRRVKQQASWFCCSD